MQQELINDISEKMSDSIIHEKYSFSESQDKINIEYESRILYSTDDDDIYDILEMYENFRESEIVYVDSNTLVDYIWEDIQYFKNSKYRLEIHHILNQINRNQINRNEKYNLSDTDKKLTFNDIGNKILILYNPEYTGNVSSVKTLVNDYEQHFLEVYYNIKTQSIRKFLANDIELMTNCINRLNKLSRILNIYDEDKLIGYNKYELSELLGTSISLNIKKHINQSSTQNQYKYWLNKFIVFIMFVFCLWFSFN
jgi:hypothetical protein